MKRHTPHVADTVAANTTTAQVVTDKRGFADRWAFSPRTIDNLIRLGLPHCKVGQRRVRIIISEADQWMISQYGVQRRSNRSTATKEAA
jgi:hypothetical protein